MIIWVIIAVYIFILEVFCLSIHTPIYDLKELLRRAKYQPSLLPSALEVSDVSLLR